MNISPISFGMSAIFTEKGINQLVKSSTTAKPEKSQAFIQSADEFKNNLEDTKYVDVVVDKTGVFFPRLKAKVVKKDGGGKDILTTVKQPRLNRTSPKIFTESEKRAKNAEAAFEKTDSFNIR